MTFNYFESIADKYCRYLSFKKPLVIRFDGVNITKNRGIDMLDVSEGGFAYAIIKTAITLSKKYHAFTFVESDEISLVISDSSSIKRKFSSNKVQKVSSILSQEVFEIFNKLYRGDTVYFDAKAFNIPFEKIESYFIYRQKSALCVCSTYIAKRHLSYDKYCDLKLEQIIHNLDTYCKDIPHDYEYVKEGIIYYDGYYIDREDFFADNYVMLVD